MTAKSDERIRKGYEEDRCSTCNKLINLDEEGMVLEEGLVAWYLCSPSCLLELAWRLKEAQVKLSKSKETA